MSKPITRPIPIRIPEDRLPQIEAAARKLGSNRSRMILFATLKFVEYAEKHGGISLPPNWSKIFKSQGKGSKQKSPVIPGSTIKRSNVR